MTQSNKNLETLQSALQVYDKVLEELADRHSLSGNYVAENYQRTISALLSVVRELAKGDQNE